MTVLGWSTTEKDDDHQRGLMKTTTRTLVNKEELIDATFESLDKLPEKKFTEYKHKIIQSLKDMDRPCRISAETTMDEYKALVKAAINITPWNKTLAIYNGGKSGPCKYDMGVI